MALRRRLRCAAVLAGLALAACGNDAVQPGRHETLADLSTGPVHACAVSTQGEVYCWGSGVVGEFGNGDETSRRIPTAIDLPVPAIRVSVGYSHSCALVSDGSVYCWGWGILGQLGGGSNQPLAGAPRVAALAQRFRSVSSGWYHTCAVAEGDTAYCWGSNRQGELGSGIGPNEIAPRKVATDVRFAQISAGAHHTCAVSITGTAYCWGSNRSGQLGTGAIHNADLPTAVGGGLRFRQVSAGFEHSCGISTEGTLYCWGSNVHGELGNAALERDGLPGSALPTLVHRVPGAMTYTSVKAGYQFTCGVGDSSKGYCWGAGVWGQLGTGFLVDFTVPRHINAPSGTNGPDALSLTLASAGGLAYACGLTTEGAVYCWGRGPNGELGQPSTTIATSPVRLQPPR